MARQPRILRIVIMTRDPHLGRPIQLGQIKRLPIALRQDKDTATATHLERLETRIPHVRLLQECPLDQHRHLVPRRTRLNRPAQIDQERGRVLGQTRLRPHHVQHVLERRLARKGRVRN